MSLNYKNKKMFKYQQILRLKERFAKLVGFARTAEIQILSPTPKLAFIASFIFM